MDQNVAEELVGDSASASSDSEYFSQETPHASSSTSSTVDDLEYVSDVVPYDREHAERGCVFRLAKSKTLSICGAAWLSVREGCVVVMGVALRPNSDAVHVVSPVWDATALLTMSAIASSIVVLVPSDTRLFVGAISPPAYISSLWVPRCFALSPTCLRACGFGAMSIPVSWTKEIQRITEKTDIATNGMKPSLHVTFVIGGKNCGKSTFARLLINSLLDSGASDVLYLDTDMGQCEYTPQGFLSVHKIEQPSLSPPCAHLQTALQSRFFGMASCKSDPQLYLRQVKELYEFCESHANVSSSMTYVVVNTHGWVSGVGLELVYELIGVMRPLFVVEMQMPSQVLEQSVLANNEVKMSSPSHEFHHVRLQRLPEEPSTRQTYVSSEKLRTLSLVSYFGGDGAPREQVDGKYDNVYDNENTTCFRTIAAILAAQAPYRVSFSDVLLTAMHLDLPPTDHCVAVLDLALVALGCCEDIPEERVRTSRRGLRVLYEPLVSCDYVGMAIVRQVDVEMRECLVLSPVSPDLLERVNVFTISPIHLPLVFHYDANMSSAYLTKAAMRSEVRGLHSMKSRGNIQRKRKRE